MDLENYVSVEAVISKFEVTQEDIDNYSKSLFLSQVALVGIKDRVVEDGDTVNIDYVGYKDEVAFNGGTASGQELVIGSGSYIEGFESGLIGVMPG